MHGVQRDTGSLGNANSHLTFKIYSYAVPYGDLEAQALVRLPSNEADLVGGLTCSGSKDCTTVDVRLHQTRINMGFSLCIMASAAH